MNENKIGDKMEKLREALEKVQDANMYAEDAREAAEEVGVQFDTKVIDLLEDTEVELQDIIDRAETLLEELEKVIA